MCDRGIREFEEDRRVSEQRECQTPDTGAGKLAKQTYQVRAKQSESNVPPFLLEIIQSLRRIQMNLDG